VFHLPLAEAAQRLGFCDTILKQHCRKLGLPKWPYRQVRQYATMIAEAEEIIRREPQSRHLHLERLNGLKISMRYIMETGAVNAPIDDQPVHNNNLTKKRKLAGLPIVHRPEKKVTRPTEMLKWQGGRTGVSTERGTRSSISGLWQRQTNMSAVEGFIDPGMRQFCLDLGNAGTLSNDHNHALALASAGLWHQLRTLPPVSGDRSSTQDGQTPNPLNNVIRANLMSRVPGVGSYSDIVSTPVPQSSFGFQQNSPAYKAALARCLGQGTTVRGSQVQASPQNLMEEVRLKECLEILSNNGFPAEQLLVISACVELVDSMVVRLDDQDDLPTDRKSMAATDVVRIATVEMNNLGSELRKNRIQAVGLQQKLEDLRAQRSTLSTKLKQVELYKEKAALDKATLLQNKSKLKERVLVFSNYIKEENIDLDPRDFHCPKQELVKRPEESQVAAILQTLQCEKEKKRAAAERLRQIHHPS